MLNFIGPNDEEGIRIYYNGQEVKRDTTKTSNFHTAGDGRIVVGRYRTDLDRDYASFMVDELIYFNVSLTSDDLQLIYNSA